MARRSAPRRLTSLDIGLCDVVWRQSFPSAVIKHLPHSYSDHCPILLGMQSKKGMRLGDMPFKFQAMWLRHRNFSSWMKEQWECDGDLTTTVKEFSIKAAWNKDTYGNVFQRKKRNLFRLEGV